MYDLRHVKSTINANGKRETVPVIKYSGHSNSVSFRLGLDISPNGSILAAGTVPFPSCALSIFVWWSFLADIDDSRRGWICKVMVCYWWTKNSCSGFEVYVSGTGCGITVFEGGWGALDSWSGCPILEYRLSPRKREKLLWNLDRIWKMSHDLYRQMIEDLYWGNCIASHEIPK